MTRRPTIPYHVPDAPSGAATHEGAAGFALGIIATLILLALAASVLYEWHPHWPPLLVVAEFVVAMLGLIAGAPGAQQRHHRPALALCGVITNVCCLGVLVLMVLAYVTVGDAG
jgi:hypothetical protein